MKFYIKEFPDDTAILMTEQGQVIWTFSSVDDALDECDELTDPETSHSPIAKARVKSTSVSARRQKLSPIPAPR